MSGHSPQTSRLLTVIAVFLCICMSGIFTRSSALPSQISPSSDAETLVSEEISLTVTPVDIPQATPTPSPKVTKAASKNKSKKSFKVSHEASEGNWTSSGSNWMFLVDGNAYTGWLTDTDGKRYYFDENGIMQTGWVDVDGKRYYMDLDGIMQTGDITIGKKSYHLNDDGSLEGYKAKKTSKKKSSKEKNRKNSSSDKTSAVSSTDSDSKKYVALTFDDGPSSFTDRLLDCLEENNAKATFFMVGTEIASFPEEVKRMKEEAQANAEADKKEKERIDKLNQADSMIFQTEKQLKDLGDKLPADKKAPIETALNKLKEAHKAQDIAGIDAAMAELNSVFQAASQEMYNAQNAQGGAQPGPDFGQQTGGNAGNNKQDGGVTDVDFEEVK